MSTNQFDVPLQDKLQKMVREIQPCVHGLWTIVLSLATLMTSLVISLLSIVCRADAR